MKRNLKKVVISSQGILLLITVGLAYYLERSFLEWSFWKGELPFFNVILYGLLIGTSIRLFSLVLGEAWPKFKDNMEETVIQLMQGIDKYDLLLISFLPAFIEEFFFRGVLQPSLVIWLTSFIFAILHWGFVKKLWAHGLHAFLISLFFGWIYVTTGSLLITVVAHFTNNLLAALYIEEKIPF